MVEYRFRAIIPLTVALPFPYRCKVRRIPTNKLLTSAAEDDAFAWRSTIMISKIYGHKHSIVLNGEMVTTTIISYNLDTTSSDSGSFDTDGTEATCSACIRLNSFTTASSVWSEDLDKTEVSDNGVDDHSIKLPLADESSVRSCAM